MENNVSPEDRKMIDALIAAVNNPATKPESTSDLSGKPAAKVTGHFDLEEFCAAAEHLAAQEVLDDPNWK